MKKCEICETTNNLELHHCFFNKNRKNSDKYGLVVWLCAEHHRGNYSPHGNREVDLMFKMKAQKKFEEIHSREEFVKNFCRNYL